jgi:hypothetical protein
MTANYKAVKAYDGLPPLFTICLEEVFSETQAGTRAKEEGQSVYQP